MNLRAARAETTFKCGGKSRVDIVGGDGCEEWAAHQDALHVREVVGVVGRDPQPAVGL